MRKARRSSWELCSFCRQIKLVSGSNHTCPDAVKIKREIDIENTVEEELVIFEIEAAEFWQDPQTKFMEYLAEKGDI